MRSQVLGPTHLEVALSLQQAAISKAVSHLVWLAGAMHGAGVALCETKLWIYCPSLPQALGCFADAETMLLSSLKIREDCHRGTSMPSPPHAFVCGGNNGAIAPSPAADPALLSTLVLHPLVFNAHRELAALYKRNMKPGEADEHVWAALEIGMNIGYKVRIMAMGTISYM